MSYIERIQLPFQSFFDIIIDSIGGSKVVISPRLNAFHVATSDDDAISYALNLSNQLASASIYHIVLFKVGLSPANTYTFNSVYALLIGNVPANVNNYSNSARIITGSNINSNYGNFVQVTTSTLGFMGASGNFPNITSAIFKTF